ncbi:MAG: CotH kinase family protein [Firmicutes bacterium]|nr:CotH kinase family protein [Bacillota bacterium]
MKKPALFLLAALCIVLSGCVKRHSYGEWIITKPADCQNEGEEARVCADCGKTETRTIPKTEHEEQLVRLFCGGDELGRTGEFVCLNCGETEVRAVVPDDVGIPVIEITGSLEGISKEKNVDVKFVYSDGKRSITSDATLKLQGTSSIVNPKKNFTIKFVKKDGEKNKIEFDSRWGAHSKYCLKANYNDFSQARNIVSARLYGQVVRDRGDAELEAMPNCGAVDGYPVLIYHNGAYLGLYTLNIPKDEWMFGMDGQTRQAMLMADTRTDSVRLLEPIGESYADSGWEVEYCSTEDDGWVRESFNRFIEFLGKVGDEELRRSLSDFIDVDRAIDSMLHTFVIAGTDNTEKNILWVTLDGEKWYPSVYDMDSAWGLSDTGAEIYPPDVTLPGKVYSNLLFERLLTAYRAEVEARYAELRGDVYSLENIERTFEEFFSIIPEVVRESERERWKDIPNKNALYDQICVFAFQRLPLLDSIFNYGR